MNVGFVDFFSGCGGMSFGFHALAQKDTRVKWLGAFDNNKHANKTYFKNFGYQPCSVDLGKAEAFKEIKKHMKGNGWLPEEKLIVIGCAPCQGFSAHRKKDKRKDARNSLVGRFAEIAVKLNPSIIVMENVPDLLAEKHFMHFEVFKKTVESANYRIGADILNMAEYGVPQERYRALVIASKIAKPSFPRASFSRSKFKTVREAIGELPRLRPEGGRDPFDPMHRTSNHRKSTIEIIKQIPLDGGSRPRGVGPKCLDGVAGFYDVYGRLAWNKPAITITARCRTPSCGRFLHPEQHRGLSIREAALLQGFPKDFIFEGPFDDCYKQIGNAVPPTFSLKLAKHLVECLKGSSQKGRDHYQNIKGPTFKSFSAFIAHNKNK